MYEYRNNRIEKVNTDAKMPSDSDKEMLFYFLIQLVLHFLSISNKEEKKEVGKGLKLYSDDLDDLAVVDLIEIGEDKAVAQENLN